MALKYSPFYLGTLCISEYNRVLTDMMKVGGPITSPWWSCSEVRWEKLSQDTRRWSEARTNIPMDHDSRVRNCKQKIIINTWILLMNPHID